MGMHFHLFKYYGILCGKKMNPSLFMKPYPLRTPLIPSPCCHPGTGVRPLIRDEGTNGGDEVSIMSQFDPCEEQKEGLFQLLGS